MLSLWPEQKWWFCTAALMGACLMAPSPSSPSLGGACQMQ